MYIAINTNDGTVMTFPDRKTALSKIVGMDAEFRLYSSAIGSGFSETIGRKAKKVAKTRKGGNDESRRS